MIKIFGVPLSSENNGKMGKNTFNLAEMAYFAKSLHILNEMGCFANFSKLNKLLRYDHFIVLAYMMNLPVEELIVLKENTDAEEHIAGIIRWTAEKSKSSDLLRQSYWEALGILILNRD